MKRLLNLIENNLERRLLQYNKNVVESTKKEIIRDVYIDGGVYKETKIDSGYAVVSLPASDDFTEQKGYYKYVSAIYPD